MILQQEGEQCVEILRAEGIAGLTFQGSGWDKQTIQAEYRRAKEGGIAGIVFLYDSDKTGLKKLEICQECADKENLLLIPIKPDDICSNLPYESSDIKEILGQMDIKEFIRRLEQEIHAAVQERSQQRETEEKEKTDNPAEPKQVPPAADIFARELAEEFKNKFIWNNEHKSWMEHEKEVDNKVQLGLWTRIDDHTIECEIQNILESRGIEGYGSDSYIQNIRKFLSRKLNVAKWNERENILPFEDGVLDIPTGKFEKHCPENHLTWCLPRKYNDNILSDWGIIRTWLNEATQGNEKDFKTLTHFAAAVLRGRYDLQIILYLWGDGGSGKGTYTRLLEAIIGEINCWSGKIESLDDSNQVARLLNKKLAIFADQDKVYGKLQLLKNLTGGDKMIGKYLYKDPFEFLPKCLSLMTANNAALQGGGVGRWFERRARIVRMNYVPTKVRDLDKEFAPELAAFTKYLLSISDDEINEVLRDEVSTGNTDPNFWEMAIRQDSLASWVEQNIIFDPNARTQVGSNKHECLGDTYNPATATLFGSYHRYCYQGNLQGRGINNFSPELEEILQKVLRHPDVQRVKTRQGNFFTGIRLRTTNDDISTISESILKCDDQCDDPVTTSVTTQNPCSDQGDDLLPKKSILNNEPSQVPEVNPSPNVNSNPSQTIGNSHHTQSQQGSPGRHTPNSPPNENTPNPKSHTYIDKECVIRAGGGLTGSGQ